MDFDISNLLNEWKYKPGEPMVRRFKGADGKDKIQLRVDLGLLQMNVAGRPDGKKPAGHESLFEYYQSRLYKHPGGHEGSDEGFVLAAQDCSKLQLEAIQYHHRCICLLQLEDYAGVIRDAERNLALFDFVAKHAAAEEQAWALQQMKPQLLMILTRAHASQSLQTEDYVQAIQQVEEGLERIRRFFREHGEAEEGHPNVEAQSLEAWLEEIRAKRPLSPRERLERALQKAVECEDYEQAAQVRDALRNLKSGHEAETT